MRIQPRRTIQLQIHPSTWAQDRSRLSRAPHRTDSDRRCDHLGVHGTAGITARSFHARCTAAPVTKREKGDALACPCDADCGMAVRAAHQGY